MIMWRSLCRLEGAGNAEDDDEMCLHARCGGGYKIAREEK